MQKYINQVTSNVRYFEDGIKVEDWIDLNEYRLMTDVEILKHETPKYSQFHTIWSGTEWTDSRTEEEKFNAHLAQFKPLTRRQFKLALLEVGLLDQIESEISAIADAAQRARIQIEYTEATEFHRTNDSVKYMCRLLGLTDQQVDEMWMGALAL